jgi:hypothetical protein
MAQAGIGAGQGLHHGTHQAQQEEALKSGTT